MRFRVLIVDDNEDLLDDCRAEFEGFDGIDLDVVPSDSDAYDLMRQHLYDMIVVDLQLDESQPEQLEGEHVLLYASRQQPTAALYAWTSYPTLDETSRLITDVLLSPDESIAAALRGLISKADYQPPLKAGLLARDLAETALRNPVEIDLTRLSEIVATLSDRRSVMGWSTPEEIEHSARVEETEYLISRLFGQGTPSGELSVPRSVEIDSFGELAAQGDEASTGNSGAAIFLARVLSDVGLPTEWVVVKLGEVDEIASEVARYERFVRYDRGARHRVELLRWARANHVGALAYSLAGPDPQHCQTLRQPISSQDPKAIDLVGTLFSTDWKHWHGTDLGGTNPYSWMQLAYEFNYLERLSHFTDGLKRAINWRANSSSDSSNWWLAENGVLSSADGLDVQIPIENLNNELSKNVPMVIVHGDLHAANVIQDRADNPRLIDYGCTGPGPRAIDFAVFEASHRVISADQMNLDACAAAVRAERKLWEAVWELDEVSFDSEDALLNMMSNFWERLSAKTMCRFRMTFPDATPTEYARVGILHGVRLAPAWWISDSRTGAKRRKHAARVRLAAWMDPMVAALRRA